MTQKFLQQLEIAQAKAKEFVEAVNRLQQIVDEERDKVDTPDLDDPDERYWR